MNKRLIAGLLLGVFFVGAMFSYSIFVSGKLKTMLIEPIQVGPATFYPGEVTSDRLGFFGATMELEKSRIELYEEVLEIPVMEVGVLFNTVTLKSPEVKGTIRNLGNVQLLLDNLKVQAALSSLDGKKHDTKVIADQLEVKNSMAELSIKSPEFFIRQDKHDYWDEMEISFPKFSLEAPDKGKALIEKFRFKQTQLPKEKGRLLVGNQLVFDSVRVNDRQESFMIDQKEVDFNLELELNGTRETLFFSTLNELFTRFEPGRVGEFFSKNGFIFNNLHAKAGAFDSKIADLSASFGSLAVLGDTTIRNDRMSSKSNGKLSELKVRSEMVDVDLAEISFTGKSEGSKSKGEAMSKALNELSSNNSPLAIGKAILTLIDALEKTSGDGNFTVTQLKVMDKRSPEALEIPQGMVSCAMKSENGVVDSSVRYSIELENIKEVVNKFDPKLSIDSAKFDFGIALERINLKVFKPLIEDFLAGKQQNLFKKGDEAMHAFVQSSPAILVDLNSVINKSADVRVKTSYSLPTPLASGISLQAMMSRQGKRDLIQGVIQSSVLDLKLKINRYQEILDMIDQSKGEGMGQMLMMQFGTFFQTEGDALQSELTLKEGKISLNGAPNPGLQNMFDMYSNM